MEVKLYIDWDGDGTFQSDEDIWPDVVAPITVTRGRPPRAIPFAKSQGGVLGATVLYRSDYHYSSELRQSILAGDYRMKARLELGGEVAWSGVVTDIRRQRNQRGPDTMRIEARTLISYARHMVPDTIGQVTNGDAEDAAEAINDRVPFTVDTDGDFGAIPARFPILPTVPALDTLRELETVTDGFLYDTKDGQLLLVSPDNRWYPGDAVMHLAGSDIVADDITNGLDTVRNELDARSADIITDSDSEYYNAPRTWTFFGTFPAAFRSVQVFSGTSPAYTHSWTFTRDLASNFLGFLTADLVFSRVVSGDNGLEGTIGGTFYANFYHQQYATAVYVDSLVITLADTEISVDLEYRIYSRFTFLQDEQEGDEYTMTTVVTPRLDYTYQSGVQNVQDIKAQDLDSISYYGRRPLPPIDTYWADNDDATDWAHNRLRHSSQPYDRGTVRTRNLTSGEVGSLDLDERIIIYRNEGPEEFYIDAVNLSVGPGGIVQSTLAVSSRDSWPVKPSFDGVAVTHPSSNPLVLTAFQDTYIAAPVVSQGWPTPSYRLHVPVGPETVSYEADTHLIRFHPLSSHGTEHLDVIAENDLGRVEYRIHYRAVIS